MTKTEASGCCFVICGAVARVLKVLNKRPIFLHVFLMTLVSVYALFGGTVFCFLEYDLQQETQTQERLEKIQCLEDMLANFSTVQQTITLFRPVAEEYYWKCVHVERDQWNFLRSTLFGYGIVTTLGAGNLTPASTTARFFCIAFGIVGIPLTMLILANIGKSLADNAVIFKQHLGRFLSRRQGKNEVEPESPESEAQTKTFIFLTMYLVYIITGALFTSLFSDQYDFFSALYFTFICVSALDFGALIPRRYEHLPVCLMYITIGMALTTVAIEVMSDFVRKLHFIGKKPKNTMDTAIWFGGERITTRDLISRVCADCGVPPTVVGDLDLDRCVDTIVAQKNEEERLRRRNSVFWGRHHSSGGPKDATSTSPLADGDGKDPQDPHNDRQPPPPPSDPGPTSTSDCPPTSSSPDQYRRQSANEGGSSRDPSYLGGNTPRKYGVPPLFNADLHITASDLTTYNVRKASMPASIFLNEIEARATSLADDEMPLQYATDQPMDGDFESESLLNKSTGGRESSGRSTFRSLVADFSTESTAAVRHTKGAFDEARVSLSVSPRTKESLPLTDVNSEQLAETFVQDWFLTDPSLPGREEVRLVTPTSAKSALYEQSVLASDSVNVAKLEGTFQSESEREKTETKTSTTSAAESVQGIDPSVTVELMSVPLPNVSELYAVENRSDKTKQNIALNATVQLVAPLAHKIGSPLTAESKKTSAESKPFQRKVSWKKVGEMAAKFEQNAPAEVKSLSVFSSATPKTPPLSPTTVEKRLKFAKKADVQQVVDASTLVRNEEIKQDLPQKEKQELPQVCTADFSTIEDDLSLFSDETTEGENVFPEEMMSTAVQLEEKSHLDEAASPNAANPVEMQLPIQPETYPSLSLDMRGNSIMEVDDKLTDLPSVALSEATVEGPIQPNSARRKRRKKISDGFQKPPWYDLVARWTFDEDSNQLCPVNAIGDPVQVLEPVVVDASKRKFSTAQPMEAVEMPTPPVLGTFRTHGGSVPSLEVAVALSPQIEILDGSEMHHDETHRRVSESDHLQVAQRRRSKSQEPKSLLEWSERCKLDVARLHQLYQREWTKVKAYTAPTTSTVIKHPKRRSALIDTNKFAKKYEQGSSTEPDSDQA